LLLVRLRVLLLSVCWDDEYWEPSVEQVSRDGANLPCRLYEPQEDMESVVNSEDEKDEEEDEDE
jgi:hypothetical protein